jgi:hypothetical protein
MFATELYTFMNPNAQLDETLTIYKLIKFNVLIAVNTIGYVTLIRS